MKTATKNKVDTVAFEQRLRSRPLWQRVIYPVIGIILIILGIIGWLLPIVPGFPLIIIGLPLLACFHPRFELWMHRQTHKIGQYFRRKTQKNSVETGKK